MGLSELFDQVLLPMAEEGGRCLFKLILVSGVYTLMRGSASESIKKIKMASIGYILLNTIQQYVNLIDRLASRITF